MADEVNHMLRTFDDIYETMPWDAVDAVVFDVGQVLLSYNPQEILDEHVPDRPDLHPILLEKFSVPPTGSCATTG